MPVFLANVSDPALLDLAVRVVKAVDPNVTITHEIKLDRTNNPEVGNPEPPPTDTALSPLMTIRIQKGGAEFLQEVKQYLDGVRPLPTQYERKRFLHGALTGSNSLLMSQGDAKFSPRGAAAGLARTMKKKGLKIDRLFTSSPMYFADGSYKGTQYTPTTFGKIIWTKLKEEGSI